MPEFLGAVSLVIAIAAYAVYLRDTFRKGVRPHVLTWLAFCIFTGVGTGAYTIYIAKTIRNGGGRIQFFGCRGGLVRGSVDSLG